MATIAAIATPQEVGGVSMIRISGEYALEIASRVFIPTYPKCNVSEMDGYTACYGKIRDNNETLDDGVLLVFRAPHSYTGEDVAEITCHGGVFVTRRVLRACLNAGAVMAQAGEFTRRALLNGKLTLTQAEAVGDVISARSEQYLRCTNAQKDGALYKRLQEIKKVILDISVQISAWIDYPDETLDSFETSSHIGQLTDCQLKLRLLLESYDIGRVMREGITAAIVGKPNVGKSTLMNLLTGVERSIVTDIAGTTRDIVEDNVMLGGMLLHLSDCAGIRETDDPVEKIGVEKMLKELENSMIVFAVFDGSKPLESEDYELINRLHGKNKRTICIINKSDLERKVDMAYLATQFGKVTEISAKNPESRLKLEKLAKRELDLERLDISGGFLANERQRECAFRAEQAIDLAIKGIESGITLDATGVMLEQALSHLMELSGENVSETVIDEVFRQFCVGK